MNQETTSREMGPSIPRLYTLLGSEPVETIANTCAVCPGLACGQMCLNWREDRWDCASCAPLGGRISKLAPGVQRGLL